jgi:hypothetical protein
MQREVDERDGAEQEHGESQKRDPQRDVAHPARVSLTVRDAPKGV